MSGINDRIKSKLDRNKGITQAAIARYCGVSTSAVAQWIAGDGIDYKHIPKIAKFLEVSQKWLTGEEDIQAYCSGEEGPPEGVIAVPEYELRFSAGGNGANEPEWEVVHASRPVWYDKEDMRRLGITKPERCKRARVTGYLAKFIFFDLS